MIPQPVLTESRSVFSVLLTQSGRPALSQAGPVTNALSVPSGVSCSARKRDSASPLEKPQPHPLPCVHINASESSATYRATSRFSGLTDVLAKVASRYRTPPDVKSQPRWYAPPEPSLFPLNGAMTTVVAPPATPKSVCMSLYGPLTACNIWLASANPCAPRAGS